MAAAEAVEDMEAAVVAAVSMAAAEAVEDMEAAVVAAVAMVAVATVVAAVVADTEVVDMAVAEGAVDTEAVDMVETAATEEVVAATAVVVVMGVAVEVVVADMAVADTVEVVTRFSLDAVLLQKKHFVLRYFPFMPNLYYSAMQYCKTELAFLAFYIRTETYNPKTPLRTLKKLYDRYDGVWTLTS